MTENTLRYLGYAVSAGGFVISLISGAIAEKRNSYEMERKIKDEVNRQMSQAAYENKFGNKLTKKGS